MTALERILAEALPTGTFGDAQPMRAPGATPRRWTHEEQARHLAALADAIGAPRLRVVEQAA
jgi:hypothetical protein